MMTHLALIMDGNRRWAKGRGLFAWLGHRQGAKTVEMVLQYCLDNAIPVVSLYTFSIENLRRSEQEVTYLFDLLHESLGRADEFIKNGIWVRFVGDLDLLPEKTRQACRQLAEQTKHGTKLQANFLVCYGGQQEVVAGVQSLLKSGASECTLEQLKQHTWLGDVPEPEVIIRTGGVQRLSNFLLLHAAYSEIRFLDCLWPDLTRDILDQTIQNCMQAHKNFGK